MKIIVDKLSKILSFIYGWGIFFCLFIGGLTFLGYLAAFIIGGPIAEMICYIIQDKIFKVLIYGGNVIVIVGLLNMYITKQQTLSVSKKQNESS